MILSLAGILVSYLHRAAGRPHLAQNIGRVAPTSAAPIGRSSSAPARVRHGMQSAVDRDRKPAIFGHPRG